MDPLATFLYARPSFLEGVARIVDFGDTLAEYNRALSGEQADYVALWADWNLIGFDLRAAMQEGPAGVQVIQTKKAPAEARGKLASRGR